MGDQPAAAVVPASRAAWGRWSRAKVLACAVLVLSAAWFITVGLMWRVPIVSVRWDPGVGEDRRTRFENELSLVKYQPPDPDTGLYLLFDSSARNLQRLVSNPFVKETAFINRTSFVLDHPPHRSLWTAERHTTLRFFVYLAILGCLGSAMTLLRSQVAARPRSTPRAPPPDSRSADGNTPPYADAARWAFVLLAVALLPVMVWLSRDFGTTWDEGYRDANGKLVLEFLRGLYPRSNFAADGEHLYGGLFDVICAALALRVPIDHYVLRHMVNATFGWIGAVYCGRLAARLFGTWAGVLAMILLVASPRYFADSMNNPKDLPFASMAIVALYYFSTVSPRWPYLSYRTALKIVMALALTLNIRAGALLYLGYLGVQVASFTVAEGGFTWRRLTDTAVSLAFVTLGVLLLGTIFWPWAGTAPLIRPIQVLLSLAHYPVPQEVHILFAGLDYSPTRLPWYYAPWWLLISTPPVVLAGAVLSFTGLGTRQALRILSLWAAAAMPMVLAIVQHSTLYNGIRQLLFIYPILVVLAASGWMAWLLGRRQWWVRGGAAALLAIGLANVLWFDIRSHPNEIVYFNELVGGPRGAFPNYEMDYWGNCVLEAVRWSDEVARQSGGPVAISGDLAFEVMQRDAARFDGAHVNVTPTDEARHALLIQRLQGGMNDFTNLAARRDVLYQVRTADGAVLCVVLPGPAFGDLKARLPALGSVPLR